MFAGGFSREGGHENKAELLLAQIETDKNYRAFTDLIKSNTEAQVYAVGGAVRDAILGSQPKDLDFVIGGVAAEDLEEYLKKFGTIKLTGKQFGVYKFVPFFNESAGEKRIEIDVALPRTEQASGQGGYRDFKTQSDPNLPIEEDLARRDFTFNAMALDLRMHKIIDPFEGQQDIKNKIVRAVGNPKERFSEDYSRMLRAVRFATKYEFVLEGQTESAIKELAPQINATRKNEQTGKDERIVAYELIGREFIWAFARNPKATLELLDRAELLREILPEVDRLKIIQQYRVFHPEGDVYTHELIMLDKLKPDASLDLQLSVLFHDLGKATAVQIQDLETKKRTAITNPEEFFTSGQYQPDKQRVQNIGHEIDSVEIAKAIIKRLRLTQFKKAGIFTINIDDVLHNVRHHLLADIDKTKPTRSEAILFKDSKVRADLLELARVDPMHGDLSRYEKAVATVDKLTARLEQQAEQAALPQPLINGRDLIKRGFKPGPIFTKILEAVRDAQLEGLVTNQEQAYKFIQDKYGNG